MTDTKQIDLSRPYIATPEAAKRSGLTRGYLSLLLRNSELEGFRLEGSREWFIYVDSFDQFLAKPRKPGPKGARKEAVSKRLDDLNTSGP